MSLEMVTISFKNQQIGQSEDPLWHKGQFLKCPDRVAIKVGDVELPLVGPINYINQLSDTNFKEFEANETINLTGYHAEVIRPHGCGISSVFMVLKTIGNEKFNKKFKTVGEFAIATLGFHKNDLVEGNKRKVGSPVFNLAGGWYHDALVFSGIYFGGVSGFRVQDVNDIDTIGQIGNGLSSSGENKVMIVISVRNEFWRLKTEKSSVSTHMVVVNGFRYSKDGKLTQIRVTDSYVSDHIKLNEWIEVDDRIRKAFTGKALFFYTNDKNN